MLEKNTNIQGKLIITTLENLMPQEHFLRDLNRLVDFSFIYEKVEHLYSQVGRPSVDPVILVKMLLLGFLYGIDSERRIEKEIQINIAYRWFLGIDLDERVPDHSTISQTRRRKFKDANIFEDIFTEIVKKCMAIGLVDGSLILTDSTHVKANASMKRSEIVKVAIEPREYVKRLEQISREEDLKVRAEALADGKEKRGATIKEPVKTKTIKVSKTDPDSGILGRPEKPKGFHYLSHQSTDAKSGIITDVHVTAGNVDDCVPYVDRIKAQKEKYGFQIKEVGLDRGYDYVEIHKEMYDLGIKTYTPLTNTDLCNKSAVFPLRDFRYDSDKDCYDCPRGAELKLSHINQVKHKKIYGASQKNCKNCPIRSHCIGEKVKRRTLQVPFFHTEAQLQRANFGTQRYHQIKRLRRIYCEGNFAIQKENYNLRRTRKRGIKNALEHCLFSALALNLKRMVGYMKLTERCG
jgi:transposase